MEDFVIVLSVGRPYDIASEDGSHITGCTMSYIATQDINQTLKILTAENLDMFQ